MTLKDNISTRNIETTCCSKILSGYTPIYDATVWELLQNQNTILLGKTNMDEFAMGSSCETSCFGGAKNPHGIPTIVAQAEVLAAALPPWPAIWPLLPWVLTPVVPSVIQFSFCGIVGLKPTYGSVSRYGLIAYASSFDQIGPITTSVEDAALVYDAISLQDSMDSTCRGGVPCQHDPEGMTSKA